MINETILFGNAADMLKTLPDASVQMCVTSPPYYGLRDYGTGSWHGGNPDCTHRVGDHVPDSLRGGNAAHIVAAGIRAGVDAFTCKLCGATRQDEQRFFLCVLKMGH